MEKRCKRNESGEILLPEAIVQRIQSFMSGREEIRTSLVSKYWYSAWSTRPNLDFDERHFELLNRRGVVYVDRFPDFVEKTIQRYKNLTIDSVNIHVNHWRHSLANSLIVKAMQMGATDLKIFINSVPTTMLSLPKELLESETLVRLYVFQCKIDLGLNDGKVSWSRLKSLTLSNVCVEGDVIWDIILGCPVIEELVLSYCKYVSGRHNMLVLGPKLFELRKLRCLSLGDMKIDTSFFSDFSLKFPCLKDLTIHDCYDYKAIKISSPTLERITFIMPNRKMLKANFEVPCIRKFTFEGSSLPSLYFGTSSLTGKLKTSISVTCVGTLSWFLKLKKFLTDLSPSRISLTLTIRTICESSCGDIQGLAKPLVVDQLKVLTRERSFVDSVLLDVLFWSFRPKLVSCTSEYMNESRVDIDFLKLLYKNLHIAENCRLPNRNTMIGCLRDLKEVNVELYDLKLGEWRPALNAYAHPHEPSSRLKLRWA